MLSLGHVVISNLVVANLSMHSPPGMILLYLAVPCYNIKGAFAWDCTSRV